MGCAPSAEATASGVDNQSNSSHRHSNKHGHRDRKQPARDNTSDATKEHLNTHDKEKIKPAPISKPKPEPTPKTKETEEKVLPTCQSEVEWEDVHNEDDDYKQDVIRRNTLKVVMGRKCHQTVDIRSNHREKQRAPTVDQGELWVDESFPLDIRLKRDEQVVWKRPHEFAEKPALYVDGTTRFDIGQGSVGTCWFLSVLSSLADHQELVRQIIVDDYNIGTDAYKGVFHCRFWRLGEWEDVYVDDRLPFRNDINRPWGSYSSTDSNEMWVSLMEKAFAKFYGSYIKVEGGNPGDAFTALTGGIADQIKHQSVSAKPLFSRIKNALESECIVACSVAGEMNKQKGLTGGHAYAVSGTSTVSLNGKRILLIRVRNPWGTERGEWNGDWSDDSPKWQLVSESTRSQLQGKDKDDGEFWININDFLKYFRDTTICSFTPDFDLDGTQDNLDKICIAFGEWKGETAAGMDFPSKYKNPRFILTVPSDLMEEDGTLPVLIQLTQQRRKYEKNDLIAVRTDLYKIEANFKKQQSIVLDELTNDTNFYVTENTCSRFRCGPGKYMILPNASEPGLEKEFMIRVFAPQPLSIKYFEESPSLYLRRFEIEDALKTADPRKYKLEHHFGQWSGKNSGGQISNESFEQNPQYAITVTDSPADVLISIKQDVSKKRDPLGLKVYKVQNTKMPLPIDYLWSKYESMSQKPSKGESFLVAYENANVFHLKPGTYALVLFLDPPGVNKDYTLSVAYRANAQVAIRGYNLCNDSIIKG